MQEDANDKLSFAFVHCLRSAQPNKARIAYFLVPVKMLLGTLPSPALLERYDLTLYQPIVQVPSAAAPSPLPALSTASSALTASNGAPLVVSGIGSTIETRKFAMLCRKRKLRRLPW